MLIGLLEHWIDLRIVSKKSEKIWEWTDKGKEIKYIVRKYLNEILYEGVVPRQYRYIIFNEGFNPDTGYRLTDDEREEI